MHMRLIRIIGLSTAVGWAAVFTWPVQAEFKLRYPIVEFRELEIEHNGSVTFDKRNSGKNNSQSYPTEVEFGFLPWWKIGLETNVEAQPGQNIHYEATALENYFQLTPQGKYWADVAFFTEVERPSSRNGANSITFGPLIQKEAPGLLFGLDTLHTVNFLLEREIDSNQPFARARLCVNKGIGIGIGIGRRRNPAGRWRGNPLGNPGGNGWGGPRLLRPLLLSFLLAL